MVVNTWSCATHREAPPALGVLVEKSWLQARWGVLERGEEPAHSVGSPLVECLSVYQCGPKTDIFRTICEQTFDNAPTDHNVVVNT